MRRAEQGGSAGFADGGAAEAQQLMRRPKASECDAPSREAPPERATAYRGCGTPREQAWMEGLLKPNN